MSVIPYYRTTTIVKDKFRYQSIDNLDSNWSADSGDWDTHNDRVLQCTSVGKVRHTGGDYVVLDSNGWANYAVAARFRKRSGLIISLCVRCPPSTFGNLGDDYGVILTLDVDANTFDLHSQSYAGGVNVPQPIQSVSHTFVDEFIQLEIWVYGTSAYAVGNGKLLAQGTISQTAPALQIIGNQEVSISVSDFTAVTLNEYPAIDYFWIDNIIPQPDELFSGSIDLMVQWRKNIESQLDAVDPTDWESFKELYKIWRNGRDTGGTNQWWWDAGYPWRKPMTEP
jgi:hypothetical protein